MFFALTHVIAVPGTCQLVCKSASVEVPDTTNPGEMYEWDWLHAPGKLQGSAIFYRDLVDLIAGFGYWMW
jgi:hypothetical protein